MRSSLINLHATLMRVSVPTVSLVRPSTFPPVMLMSIENGKCQQNKRNDLSNLLERSGVPSTPVLFIELGEIRFNIFDLQLSQALTAHPAGAHAIVVKSEKPSKNPPKQAGPAPGKIRAESGHHAVAQTERNPLRRTPRAPRAPRAPAIVGRSCQRPARRPCSVRVAGAESRVASEGAKRTEDPPLSGSHTRSGKTHTNSLSKASWHRSIISSQVEIHFCPKESIQPNLNGCAKHPFKQPGLDEARSMIKRFPSS